MKKLYRFRDAISGRFKTRKQAEADPQHTVVETIDHIHMAGLELISTLRTTGDDALLSATSASALDRLVDALGD